VRVERFDFESRAVGLREERYGTVCDGAIDVHKDNLDLRGAFFERRRDFCRAGRQSVLQIGELNRKL
jgi:hypothetical protein